MTTAATLAMIARLETLLARGLFFPDAREHALLMLAQLRRRITR